MLLLLLFNERVFGRGGEETKQKSSVLKCNRELDDVVVVLVVVAAGLLLFIFLSFLF